LKKRNEKTVPVRGYWGLFIKIKETLQHFQ